MTHPLVRELLAMLPPPDAPFSRQRRQLWIEAADAVLTLVYGDAEDPDDAEPAGEMNGVVDESSAAASDPIDAAEPWQAPAEEPYNGSSTNGSSTNGSGSWSSNGHDVPGRHRRPDFGRL